MSDSVTFRLTMPQFQQMLSVVLGPTVADEISNRVLVVCTRPKDGVTDVPLERAEAETISRAVAAAAQDAPELAGIASLLQEQVRAST